MNLMRVPNLDAALAPADVVVLLEQQAQYDVDRLSAENSLLLDTRKTAPSAPTIGRL